jgi:hypothetical protein
VEALGTWSPLAGPVGRLEAGWHPVAPMSAFVFGEWGPVVGPSAGAGARWQF